MSKVLNLIPPKKHQKPLDPEEQMMIILKLKDREIDYLNQRCKLLQELAFNSSNIPS